MSYTGELNLIRNASLRWKKSARNIIDGNTMFNQDFKEFIESVPGVTFNDCYSEKLEVILSGIPVNFIDLENLKKSKKASGRLQDLADLEKLEGE
jgi:hypothetical protein